MNGRSCIPIDSAGHAVPAHTGSAPLESVWDSVWENGA